MIFQQRQPATKIGLATSSRSQVREHTVADETAGTAATPSRSRPVRRGRGGRTSCRGHRPPPSRSLVLNTTGSDGRHLRYPTPASALTSPVALRMLRDPADRRTSPRRLALTCPRRDRLRERSAHVSALDVAQFGVVRTNHFSSAASPVTCSPAPGSLDAHSEVRVRMANFAIAVWLCVSVKI